MAITNNIVINILGLCSLIGLFLFVKINLLLNLEKSPNVIAIKVERIKIQKII